MCVCGGGGGGGGRKTNILGVCRFCGYFWVNSNGFGVISVILSFFHEVNVQNGDIYLGYSNFIILLGAGVVCLIF